MNCKKAKKKIPLLLGKELSGKKEERLKSHIGRCSSCQKEFRELELAMAKLKTLVQEEKAMDWDQAEWQTLIRQIISQKIERKAFPLRFLPKLAAAYGFAFIILSVLFVFLFRTIIIKQKSIAPWPEEILVQNREPLLTIPGEEKEESTELQVMAKAQKPLISPTHKVQAASQPKKAESQESLSVTFVSQETGLRVVWVFNKNFEWKENEK